MGVGSSRVAETVRGEGHGGRPAVRLRRWVLRVGVVGATVLAVEFLAVHVLGAHDSWRAVRSGDAVPLVLAFAAELASFACFSALTRALLPEHGGLSYPTTLAIDLTGNGVAHVVPGGAATAAALRFRLLSRHGVPARDAIGMAALESAVTSLWLVAGLGLGLLVAVPHPSTAPIVRAAALIAVVLLLTSSALVTVLTVRPDLVETVTHELARHLPLTRPDQVERIARALIEQVRVVTHSARHGRRILLWSLGYWLFDAVSLYCCVSSFAAAPNPGGLLAIYALVGLVALLPVTPGGLGIVEGVAIPLLVSFGSPQAGALLGVLSWRLFGFWLPIPMAGVAYLWIRVPGPRNEVHRPKS